MAEECLIRDVILFAKEHRHFERWLPVRLGFVVQRGVGECMVNLVPSHVVVVAGCAVS